MTHRLGWQYEQYPEVRKVLDQGEARMATSTEYADWLEGHLWNRWGSVDFDFLSSKSTGPGVYVVTKDIELPPLSGALGLKIIVPQGVNVKINGDIGDNEVFYMDDYSARMSKNHKMGIFSDVLSVLGERGYSAESFLYATPRAQEDFNQSVVRPSVAKAVHSIQVGLSEDMTVRRIQLKPKTPQT